MEATFVVKQEQLTPEWLEQMKSQFANDGTITITVTGPDKPPLVEAEREVTQRDMFKRMLETRKKYPPKKLPTDIDINKLIDEMYWQGNH